MRLTLAYQTTVLLDQQVTKLILQYQSKEDPDILVEIFDLLFPVTKQEISKMLKRMQLRGRDYFSDMRQDAFIKLKDAIKHFEYFRCHVFITYWRKCLYRHLLATYAKEQLFVAKCRSAEDIADNGNSLEKTLNRMDASANIEQIISGLAVQIKEFSSGRELAYSILKHRIFCSPLNKVDQKTIGTMHGISQGYVSRWERWLLREIRNQFFQYLPAPD